MANIMLAPEDLSNVAWTNSFSIDAQAQGTAPDGTNTLNKVTSDGGGSGSSYMRQDHNLPTHGEWWAAVFAKSDQTDFLAIQNAALDNTGVTFFDLSAGTVETASGNHSTSIVDYGDGFYRCAIGFTTSTDKIGHFRFYAAESGSLSVIPVRDGSHSIFMWGFSLNTGSEPEPYTSVAGVTLGASSDRLVSGVPFDVTRDVTRGVTESWSNR